MLVDLKSFLIVLGGTMGVGFVCFPAARIFKLLKVFFSRVFGKRKANYESLVNQIVALSKAWRKGGQAYENAISETQNLFLKDGAESLYWLESDVSGEEIRDLLESRAKTFFDEYMEEAKVFKVIGKFPPAFGLMGTTLGLIALLQSIGKEGGVETLGPSMAVALITTLYGLFLANFIFVPIAENLEQQTHEDAVLRVMCVEGLMMIQEGKPTKYVEEKVKAFLLPSVRNTFKSTLK